LKLILILFSFFLTNNLFSQEIRTIDLIKIININKQYNEFLNLLDDKKKQIEINITDQENSIRSEELYIEENKLIINHDDLNIKIVSINNKYNILENYVNKYNYYIDQNININKNILLNKIAEVCKNISIEKNFDIILDNNNYFISLKDTDITNLVLEKIKNEKINFAILKEKEIFEN
jgi:Skp family chaperone for outer membrane proteins